MSFKEKLQKLGEKSKQRKEMIRQMDEQLRMEKLVLDRQKSANLRELERYEKEDFELAVKNKLNYMRKKRQRDIDFGHNPLNAENVVSKKGWEVMKEKNLFKNQKNIFVNQPCIHKNNPNLFKNSRRMFAI
jgi:hypothetical protein